VRVGFEKNAATGELHDNIEELKRRQSTVLLQRFLDDRSRLEVNHTLGNFGKGG